MHEEVNGNEYAASGKMHGIAHVDVELSLDDDETCKQQCRQILNVVQPNWTSTDVKLNFEVSYHFDFGLNISKLCFHSDLC